MGWGWQAVYAYVAERNGVLMNDMSDPTDRLPKIGARHSHRPQNLSGICVLRVGRHLPSNRGHEHAKSAPCMLKATPPSGGLKCFNLP